MSRSFKKNPGYKDKDKFCQKYANRKVRRTEDLCDGMFYKRVYNQYNITDYKYPEFTRENLVYKLWPHRGHYTHDYLEWYEIYNEIKFSEKPCYKYLKNLDYRSKMK